ncbi:MAG: trehalase family glycosidase [Kiritimatiellia bacterium]
MNPDSTTETLGTLWPEARNILRYDREDCVLSDFHSPVAVGAWNTDAMGITRFFLQSYAPTAENPVFDPLFRVFCREDASWQPVPVSERDCWPGGWVERGRTSSFEIEQRTWFPWQGELHVSWSVRALNSTRTEPALALSGGHAFSPLVLQADTRKNGLRVRMETPQKGEDGRPLFNAVLFLDTDPGCRSCVFRTSPSQNSLPPEPSETGNNAGPGRFLGYWMELPSVKADPEGAARFEAAFTWEFMDTPMCEPEEKPGFTENIQRWKNLISRAAVPAEAGAYWQRKGSAAAADIVTSLVGSPGYGNMSDKLAIGACTLHHLSHSYYWDTMTTVPVLGLLDEEWAAQVIENFTRHLDYQDLPPFALSAFPVIKNTKKSWGGGMAPIASWALCKLMDCAGKTATISRLYSQLKEVNERWFRYGDSNGDGIPEWVNTGATADDSPLYDAYAGSGKWHNIYLPPIASVCLCSYLLMDMRCLGKMASHLGLKEESGRWNRQASDFEKRIIELLWDEKEKIFYDRDLTSYTHTKVKTFFNLLPLWAGVSMPEDEIRAAIENHLLNPREMWGEVPFPSVAYSEPTYEPFGYWRGRTWPHVYFWNTEILARYGYTREAAEAKRRFLSVMADGIDLPENFISSIETPDRHLHGLPHYSWGLSVLLFFLWDWHLKPI